MIAVLVAVITAISSLVSGISAPVSGHLATAVRVSAPVRHSITIGPIVAGGQATLDSGAITMISDPAIASMLTTVPGDAGTVWLAGHRSSHGGVFAAIPDLQVGEGVIVSYQGVTATYVVVGQQSFNLRNDQVIGTDGVASGVNTVNSILRPDQGAGRPPRLVLQTCDGDTVRIMVYADLVR